MGKILLDTERKFKPKDFIANKFPSEIMTLICDYLNVLRKRYLKYKESGDEKKRRMTLEKAVILLNYLDLNFRIGFDSE